MDSVEQKAELMALADVWTGRAQALYWNLPDDSTPVNVALGHCRISEAHALERCADELREALAARAEVVG